MYGITTVFHFLSLLGFFAALWWWSRSQFEQRLQRRLWQACSSPQPAIMLAAPGRLLPLLCRLWGVRWSQSVALEAAYKKFELREIARAQLHLGFSAMQVKSANLLTITVKNRPEDGEDWPRRLEQALQMKVELTHEDVANGP